MTMENTVFGLIMSMTNVLALLQIVPSGYSVIVIPTSRLVDVRTECFIE